ncbi:MAG: hypothetical protein HN368_13075 [Spirochaetales bacterium]|nr:hypothetical protein [Spirochaetales bacterium]
MASIVLEDTKRSIPATGVVYYPTLDQDGENFCLAWSGYLPDKELLFAKVGGDIVEVCRADAIGPPSVAGRGRNVWEVTSAVVRNHSRLVERYLIRDGLVRPLAAPFQERLSESKIEEVKTFRPRTDSGSLDSSDCTYLAVTSTGSGRRVVELFSCTDDECMPLFESPSHLKCYRPSICVHEHQPVVAYDAWDGESYQIYSQSQSGITRISDGTGWNINTDVMVDSNDTLWACWIHNVDVISSSGVYDGRNTIQVTRPSLGQKAIQDVEDISHGLIDTDPEPRGVWGYLGRRRHPMMLQTSSGLKLVWEQKKEHAGPTRRNTGVLWMWDVDSRPGTKPSAFCDDALWYQVPESKQVLGDAFPVACFRGIYTDDRTICAQTIDLTKPIATRERLPLSSWKGWQNFTLPDTEMTVEERPRISTPDGELSLYWFDLHCHTVMSADAEGEIDECVRRGRYTGLLDGVLVTDNDHYVVPLNHHEWRASQDVMEELTQEGRFVALTGYEWTSRPIIDGSQIIDHRSVILPEGAGDIVRWNEVHGDIDTLYEHVQNRGGLVHGHHSDWNLSGHAVEANIEACSSWDPYLEIDPGPFHRELRRGNKIGLIGGSDEHRRNPGLGGALTGIWAKDLTVECIIEALKNHRCYATMGRKVTLDFRINDQPMGSAFTGKLCVITVSADSPVPIEAVELYEDGEIIHTWNPGEQIAAVDLEYLVPKGCHSYYVKLILDGPLHRGYPSNIQPMRGARVWSSPIWGES